MQEFTNLKLTLYAEGISNVSISILDEAFEQMLRNEVLVRSLAKEAGLENMVDADTEYTTIQVDLSEDVIEMLKTQSLHIKENLD